MTWRDNDGTLRTSGNAGWVLLDNPYPDLPNYNWERRWVAGGFWDTDPDYLYPPHSGVDYGANKGERVASYDWGEVLATGWDDVFGNYIFVYHPAIEKTTFYAHLTDIYVHAGQNVKAQEVIGTVGNTGSVNGVGYGDHLHIGIQEGRSTNMFKYDNAWYDFDTFNYRSHLVDKGDTFGDRVIQHGIFTVITEEGVNVRNEPSVDGERVNGLPYGDKVQYDSYIDNQGIRWVSWVMNGERVYSARRTLDGERIFGNAEFIDYQDLLDVDMYEQVGQFTFTQDSHILDFPDYGRGTKLGTYYSGETVPYEGWCRGDGHLWLYYTKDGQTRFVAYSKNIAGTNDYGYFL